MFKDRQIKVSFPRNDKDPQDPANPRSASEVTETAKQVAAVVADKIIFGVALYVGLDTLRQVIVKSTRSR